MATPGLFLFVRFDQLPQHDANVSDGSGLVEVPGVALFLPVQLVVGIAVAGAVDDLGFVIDFMVNLLTDLTVYRRLYSPPNLELWKQGRAHQIDLVIALRDGDADRARAIMTDHMQTAWTLMRGQEVEMRNRFISE